MRLYVSRRLPFALPGTRLSMLLILLFGTLEGIGQAVFFSENIGTPSATTAVNIYTGWQNTAPVTYTGTSDVRTSTASNGYVGASGGGNVFITNTVGNVFLISGINSSGFSSVTLSLGHYKSVTAANNELKIEVSPDGVTYTSLTYSRPTGSGTAVWLLINPSGTIPSTANLRLRFTQNSASAQFRIDDIKLSGIPSCAAPTLQASAMVAATTGFQNLNISFTNGNGSGRIVCINTTNSFTDPVNGTDPPANSFYSLSGQQVVYNGSSSSVNVTGLDPCRDYWFRVYEYNCSGSSILFNLTTATGNPAMISTSSNPPSSLTLASENFDGATSLWNYTYSCQNFGTTGSGTCVFGIKPSPFGYLSSKALVKSHSVNNGSGELVSETTVDFAQVTIPSGASNIIFSFRLASLNQVGTTAVAVGAGNDTGDSLTLAMQLNSSGIYSRTFTQNGSSDKLFDYVPDEVMALAWNQNVLFSTPNNDYNHFTVNIPDGSTTVNVRFLMRNNRIGENWCLDNMLLTADMPTATTLPALFSITGNISFCAGSDGTLIGLTGSQSGINYQLFLNGTAVGSAVPGTGSAIEFGYQTAAGTYTVVATNLAYVYCHSDMLNPLIVTLKPAPVIIGIVPTPASCGTDNGTLTITASGGTPAYQYSIDNGATWQPASVFTHLAAGTYYVKVKDVNCESLATTATVTLSGTTLTATVVPQPIACLGGTTGSATITASGGTGTLSYSWNTLPVQNTATATNLAAGTYICTITDVALCSIDITVEITEPLTALTAGIVSITPVLCYGSSLGGAEVSGSGGTAPYTFTWNTTPAQSGATIANLPAGNYICHVVDALGCFKDVPVVISQPATLLTATVSASDDATCYGGSNGSATANVSGGTATYSYEWNTAPTQNTATAINLPAGFYTCTITDANGCTTAVSATISQPASALSGSISAQTSSVCTGAANGTATILAAGGTPGYTYLWNTTPAQTLATGSNLGAGSYTCTLTDSKGCTIDVPVTITSYPPPTTADAGNPQTICGLTATLNGNQPVVGSGLWTKVSGPSTLTIVTPTAYNSAITTTAPGTFSLQWKITNEITCPSSSDTVEIVFGNSVTVIAGSNSPVCTGDTIKLTSSIAGASNYSWIGPGFTSALQNPKITPVLLSQAGSYTVTVSGIPGGCPGSNSSTLVAIEVTPTAPVSLSANNMEVCSNAGGNIILTALGGSGSVLEWFEGSCEGTSIGSGTPFSLPSPTVSTTYYAHWASTNCGNSECAEVTIIVKDPPTPANAGGDQAVCGGLSATLSGNNPAIGSGQWSLVSGPGIPVFANAFLYTTSVSVPLQGIYIFRWTIGNGVACLPSTDDVQFEFGNAITVTAGSNSPLCSGNNIHLTSDIAMAAYSWTGPDNFISGVQNPDINNASPLKSGKYKVMVSSIPGGCPTTTDSTIVTVNATPLTGPISSSNISLNQQDVCTNSLFPYTIAPSTSGSVYTWNLTGGGTIIPTGNSNLININWSVPGGPYVLSVIETATGGCTGVPVTLNIMVNQASTDSISITPDNNPVCTNTTVTFTSKSVNGGIAPTYKWFVNGIQSAITDSVFSFIPLDNDKVYAQLISSSPCAIPNPALSKISTMSVTTTVAAGITITSSAPASLCSGDAVTIKATSVNGGSSPAYSWYLNGSLLPGEVTDSLKLVPANGDAVYAKIVSNSACALPAQATSTTITFNVNSALPAGVNVIQKPILCQADPVTITATPANGGPLPAYEWFLNHNLVSGQQLATYSGMFAKGDTISARVTSSLGCATGNPATSNELFVTRPDSLIISSVDTVNETCGLANGILTINAHGGTGNLQYSIASLPQWVNSPVFDSLAAYTAYNIQVKDANGCIAYKGVYQLINKPGATVSTSGGGMYCEGDSVRLQVTSATPLSYQWTYPSGTTSSAAQVILLNIAVSDSGQFRLAAKDLSTGCADTAWLEVKVAKKPVVSLGLPNMLCAGSPQILTPGAGYLSYLWQDGSTAPEFTATDPGIYYIKANDSAGCSGSDTLTLMPCSQVYIPTAFAPGGSGSNTHFRPVCGGIVLLDFTMVIYSRWGQKILESNDYVNGWNGTLNGVVVPAGSYAYFITYKIADPTHNTDAVNTSKLRGTVMVVR